MQLVVNSLMEGLTYLFIEVDPQEEQALAVLVVGVKENLGFNRFMGQSLVIVDLALILVMVKMYWRQFQEEVLAMMALPFYIEIFLLAVIWVEVFVKAMIANIRVSIIKLPIIFWAFAIPFFFVLVFLIK